MYFYVIFMSRYLSKRNKKKCSKESLNLKTIYPLEN